MKKNIEPLKKPFKVLLVDDDINMIKSMEKILFNKNYTIFSALSGKEALQKIGGIEPDIILLDIVMPEIDGYQVCKEIKSDDKYESVPLLFLTETTDSDVIIKAFEHDAVDFLVKPFNPQVMLARVDTHLLLKKSQETLKEVNQIKLKFFSIMTKDIKDSLIGVKGMADFLVQDLQEDCHDSTEGIKMAKILQDDSKKLYALLENIIDYASIETSHITISPKEISVSEFCKNTVALYKDRIDCKDLKIELNCPNNIKLFNDVDAIKIIFLKILSNAIKYSQQGGQIFIDVSKKGNKCVFSITDHGVGMEPDVVNNIFRLDTPHPKTIGTADEKGTGLGLIICNALVEKLSGSIQIESKKFRGAKVTFELPDIEH